MRKSIGVQPAIFPMPVLIVAAYDKDGVPNAMNAAWGTACDGDKILLILSEDHKTTKNIRETKAFTVSLADKDNIVAADYFGIASGNNIPDKFAKSGCHAEKSGKVNAPIITEFTITMECELVEITETENLYAIIGKIVDVTADEKVLTANGKVDTAKLNALIFDQFGYGYYVAGEKVGRAWNSGKELFDKAK